MQGLILINKPKGITSFSAVSKLKWLCETKRVGHTGTLDPMATGVLPILIGRPTVLANYILEADKEYIAEVKLGIKTDTLDITGKVVGEKAVDVTAAQLKNAAEKFLGKISQLPPMYSAIKKDGVRLYQLAREGKETEREARTVNIKELEIFDFNKTDFKMRVLCSKGTYIRSLADDLGEALGTYATLTRLERTKTAGFSIENTVSLDELTRENVANYILNEEEAVLNYPKINITKKQAIRFSNGGELSAERLRGLGEPAENKIYRVKFENVFVGLGKFVTEKSAISPAALINFVKE